MDILSIMEISAEIEDRAALLYHTLSLRFKKNPSGYNFWEKLSREEKAHADKVRTYCRQRLNLPVYRKGHPELIDELENLKKHILKKINEAPDKSISEALQMAYHIEGLMAHAHLSRICEIKDPLLAKLLIKLGYEDRHHQERIRHFNWMVPER